ncbi:MAG TPA: LPS assembly protein LptD [Hyphomonadaceae bacterium]|nr:LPS assembly protein LptD [Hyphomonadaceae bacterium]
MSRLAAASLDAIRSFAYRSKGLESLADCMREGSVMVLRLTALASAMAVLSAGTAAAQTPAPAPTQAPPQPNPATAPPAATSEAARDQVVMQADSIVEDRNTLITVAEGNVEVRYKGKALKADRLIFDQTKQSMRAQGRVQIIDETGSVTFADEIEGDEAFDNGFATGFSVRMPKNAVATASSAVRSDGNRNTLQQAVFTACPICADGKTDPTWQIRAREAVLDQDDQMISYSDAVLEIKGIPIFYIPWFAHPDPSSKRRSGFLIPDIGTGSKLGLNYEQPYYWAISPSQDLTISPMISQNVNPLVKVDYRKRFFSGEVEFNASGTYESDFDGEGEKLGPKEWRSHIYGRGLFSINQDWKWGFGVEHQSDDLYDMRYDIDGEDDLRGLYASQPRQLVTQLFTQGQTPDFYFEAGSYVFQGLREGDIDKEFPRVAPAIFTEKVFDFGQAGQLATDFSAAALFREERELIPAGDPNTTLDDDTRLNSIRASGTADWGAQYIVGPGLVVEPFAQGRGDFYNFIVDKGAGRVNKSRFLGVAGTQVSYPFIRHGKTIDIKIEPVVMAAYGSPDVNDLVNPAAAPGDPDYGLTIIPNEDSLVFEQDESNLFKPNPVTGYDLWEGGARVAVGISGSALIGKDIEVSTLIGRRWREDADPAFNDLSNLANEKSDYVASVKLDLGDAISVGSRMRLDDSFNVNRIDLSASANFWGFRGNARYFKVAKNAAGSEDEGITWDGAYKISQHFSAFARQTRNITIGENILSALGINFEDECSRFSLYYERSGGRDRTLGPSEGIRFEYALTGLGN